MNQQTMLIALLAVGAWLFFRNRGVPVVGQAADEMPMAGLAANDALGAGTAFSPITGAEWQPQFGYYYHPGDIGE